MKKIVILTTCLLTLSGCQNSDIYSGNVYTADQAKQVQQVNYGVITSINNVKIQTNASDGQSNSVVGTIAGAVLGGLIGSTVGGGTGQAIAATAGAIGGGIAGDAVQNEMSQTNALQIEIKPDNSSSSIIIVQKAQQGEFYVGQRVRIISSGNSVSVSP